MRAGACAAASVRVRLIERMRAARSASAVEPGASAAGVRNVADCSVKRERRVSTTEQHTTTTTAHLTGDKRLFADELGGASGADASKSTTDGARELAQRVHAKPRERPYVRWRGNPESDLLHFCYNNWGRAGAGLLGAVGSRRHPARRDGERWESTRCATPRRTRTTRHIDMDMEKMF